MAGSHGLPDKCRTLLKGQPAEWPDHVFWAYHIARWTSAQIEAAMRPNRPQDTIP